MPQDTLRSKSSEKLPPTLTIALIALGSNRASREGTPAQAVKSGIAAVAKKLGVIRGQSRLYQTPAFPPGNGADYVNAALGVETDLPPQQLIKGLHDIEALHGRTRVKRWEARTLDLDLIGMGELLLPDAETHEKWRGLSLEKQVDAAPEELILPHPRVQERAFVLVPLADVAPDWVHPALGLTVRQMVAALPTEDIAQVQPLPQG
ncbi:2-amino-4-hydroxy-6-hydroxymethyldihydropteridine pyrophosphokinase [Roseobacter cerasinus]|uniref:2-amino-4-hydroxy-6-hydroxymethyldihydropteridine pyrophosphokinase n=1 Tax=Roseobacter cerasinus TaxID=2602289 RepID=A0A640VVS3_9RHOB|nr:2-amino-4-hydroxy-6-hydroxymethyldihydropteridine diphosphokinase [Roseobacter cerasinus]GFE50995.1 2-amino-4-hydroxy-6-hydroxymethyldihydropteridine pyrophosphokinase [Roseobacter cerasinus]